MRRFFEGSRASTQQVPVPAQVETAIDSDALFRRYASFVASFLYRLGAREAELEDLVQDVFVTAHRKGGYQPGPASPTTFLARLALEARLSTRRRNHRWQLSHDASIGGATFGADATSPEHDLALRQAAAQMQQALDRMEPGVRAVFVLFELEGQSCEAIGAGLNLKIGTVYSRLHHARAAFHEHVARSTRLDSDPPPRLARSGT